MSTDKNLLKRKVLTGIYWTFLERSSVQLMQVVVQIILARLLLPSDFGVVAIVMVFIYLADILLQSGFATALIQKQNTDNLDYSSAFYFSLVLSLVLYIIIYFMSPVISAFYKMPILVKVLPILALTLFPDSLNSVQIAYVKKQMNFKVLFKCNLVSIFISGFISVIMALTGFGIWALVTQKLIYQFLVSFLLLFNIEWKPSLIISFTRLRIMYSYGIYILGVSLIERIYTQIFNLIIGKIYGSSPLAYYNRGLMFPILIVANINDGIQTVMFSALSLNQENKEIFKIMTSRVLNCIALLVVPLLMGLFVIGENLILILLTEKWLPCLFFLKVSCVKYMFYPIYSANIQVFKAMGKSKIYFSYVFYHKIFILIIVFFVYNLGVNLLVLIDAIIFIVYSVICAVPNKRYIDYGYKEQFNDLMPIYLISIAMSMFIYFIQLFNFNILVTLVLQIILGFIVFVLLACLIKLQSFYFIKNLFVTRYFK